MPWIRVYEENEARELLAWVYRVARWTQGRVPKIVKASSLNPRVLAALDRFIVPSWREHRR